MNFLLVREGVGFGDAPAYKEENMTICHAATGYRSCSEMIMLISIKIYLIVSLICQLYFFPTDYV